MTEGKEEQIAHAVNHVQNIIAHPQCKLGQGFNIGTAEDTRSNVCVCVCALASKVILWSVKMMKP